MDPTRRLRALHLARARNAHREPGLTELILGLTAFLALAAACLYVAAALGA